MDQNVRGLERDREGLALMPSDHLFACEGGLLQNREAPGESLAVVGGSKMFWLYVPLEDLLRRTDQVSL